MFPLPPREAVVVAEMVRLLGARVVGEGVMSATGSTAPVAAAHAGGLTARTVGVCRPPSPTPQPSLFNEEVAA